MRLTKLITSRIIVPSDAEVARTIGHYGTSSHGTAAEEELLLYNIPGRPTSQQQQIGSHERNPSSSTTIHSTRTRGRSLGSFDYNEKPVLSSIKALSPTNESVELTNDNNNNNNTHNNSHHNNSNNSPFDSITEEPTESKATSREPTYSQAPHPFNNHKSNDLSNDSDRLNDTNQLHTPSKLIRSFHTFKLHTQIVAVRIAKSRFIIKHNVSVPLWLILPLPFIVLALLCWALAVILLSNPANGGMSHTANGLPKVREISGKVDKPFVLGCMEPQVDEPRANAVLVVLARNKEIEGVLESMHSLERHWNRWFNYPYVFLNDEPFNSTFKAAIQNATKSEVKFGTIDKKVWNFPEWADEAEINEAIAKQGDRAIMYGGMASYHRMCRFYSGAFFNHPLLAEYTWYWRVEPEVKYFCDITYDPFKYMEKHKKVYGFTIVIKELVETVPNLFRHTAAFKKEHNITSKGMWELFLSKHDDSEMGDSSGDSGSVRRKKKQQLAEEKRAEKLKADKLQESLPEEAIMGDKDVQMNGKIAAGRNLYPLDDNEQLLDIDNYDYLSNEVPAYSINGETYNMCHFWSNFEIARLDFFRSDEYKAYFEALDRTGGFWNERWGDAPVHSLAAGLFLAPEQVHYFRDIGYRHTTIQHCPANAPERQLPHIPYIQDPNDRKQIEEDDYWAQADPEVLNGVGCRCRCDTDVVEVEGKDGSCLSDWVELTGGWV